MIRRMVRVARSLPRRQQVDAILFIIAGALPAIALVTVLVAASLSTE